MEKQLLATGIMVYKNVMPTPGKVLQYIEEVTKQKILNWQEATVKAGEEIKVNYETRRTDIIGVPHDFSKITADNPRAEARLYLSKLFYDSFDAVEKDYMSKFNMTLKTHEDWGILRYSIGQKFTNHIDDLEEFKRRVSAVYYFNDNYEGGEITFPRFNVSYKPKSNEMLLFPSSYVYNHSVSEVTSGTRYAAVSWLC